MKKLIFICLFFLFTIPFIMADDEVPAVAGEEIAVVEPVAEPVVDAPAEEGSGIGSAIWAFMNSSVGVTVVAFLLSVVVGKVFTAKPKWKQYVLKYGPEIMQAVKVAEKKIPDGSGSVGLARLDEALKYLKELEPKLKGAMENDLKQALTAIHAKAESSGNLNTGS